MAKKDGAHRTSKDGVALDIAPIWLMSKQQRIPAAPRAPKAQASRTRERKSNLVMLSQRRAERAGRRYPGTMSGEEPGWQSAWAGKLKAALAQIGRHGNIIVRLVPDAELRDLAQLPFALPVLLPDGRIAAAPVERCGTVWLNDRVLWEGGEGDHWVLLAALRVCAAAAASRPGAYTSIG